ncbi:sialyltransferase [Chloropicon primus]|uniref:Sialyltransferase n=1 Tax=Chloropicon primus TaxID=1764295 RepID=A0A5B8MV81_9CHLO|nr:sialyltransferase [Chloropicon primus]UPR02614.1 sialyltransferase [Chloropicon primus]|eukprot:QDZ23402.1 sialyltransferase [Chloropicon primus]
MGFFVRKNYRPARVPKKHVLSDSPSPRGREFKFTRYAIVSWLKRNILVLVLLLVATRTAYIFSLHHRSSSTAIEHPAEAVSVEGSKGVEPLYLNRSTPEAVPRDAGEGKRERRRRPSSSPSSSGSSSSSQRSKRSSPSSPVVGKEGFNVISKVTGKPLPWKWENHDGLWRRVYPQEVLDKYNGGEAARPDITWFERRTVQDRLDFNKFINCTEHRTALPDLEGLNLKSKLEVNNFIVHQGNYERLGKGEGMNRTDRVRNVELLPPDGESVLRSRHWGSCAIVGNSGHLHFTEYMKSINSHDTVIRVNQAPALRYWRRVGSKTTHRVLNRLWTRTYRNSRGMKKGEVLPVEQDLTFIVTRANTQEYELLQDYLAETRPDVKLMYMSSRATSMAQPLLAGYREKLCEAGYGPYLGLNVPSSGYVMIYFLLSLCDAVSVYGFGVSPINDGPQIYPYHYYKGVGMRKVGDPVHSFDSEEMLLKQLGKEDVLKFCMYKSPKDDPSNWSCGCRHPDIEDCRPDPLPEEIKDEEDCTPQDCETREEKQERKSRLRKTQRKRTQEREVRDQERRRRRERERAAASEDKEPV